MARWRLTVGHYLNVPGTEWEYKEADRATGKMKRVMFPVPRLLDPNDPTDWTEVQRDLTGKPIDGVIIVCHEGKGLPADHIFTGDPTPDMEPLDDEAKAISAALAPKWNHPIDSLPGTYGQSLIDGFQAEMAQAAQAPTEVKIEGMTEMLASIASMLKQNQEIMRQLTGSAPAARRA